MTRIKRAITGVASSYLLLASAAFYSLASVPLALHYLDKSHFGLWIVIGGLAGYLNLIDGGVSGASNRLLIEHKDQRDGGFYGGLIKTSSLICLIQGIVVFVLGFIISKPVAYLLKIPGSLYADFFYLFVLNSGAVAIGLIARIFGAILTAHQRMDLGNYIGILGLVLSFSVQWICFHQGYGVISMAYAALASSLVSGLLLAIFAYQRNLFPSPGCWGSMSWMETKEIFLYSKDLFLASLGTSLIRSSPSIVITRMLGLESSAAWGVGTRVYNLLCQIVWKITDMSGGAFAEMMVRGEIRRLQVRYQAIASLSFSLAGWVAVSFAFTNALFVSVWTHNKISWSIEYDFLLGILLLTSTIIHSHNYFILNTKKIKMLPYVYLVEGCLFVTLSLLLVHIGGLPAIILSSVICGMILSGSYGIFRVSRYFGTSVWEVAFKWLEPAAKMMIWYLPVSALNWFLLSSSSEMTRLTGQVIVDIIVGLPLFLYIGLPDSLKEEFRSRVPSTIRSLIPRPF